MPMDLVASLLRNVSAGQPTEHALLQDNRRLNEENSSLQARLQETTSQLEAVTKTLHDRQESSKRVINAYTALKRDNMMKEVIAVHMDYLTADLTAGSREYAAKVAHLALDVTAMHDKELDLGIGCDVLTTEDAEPLYSTEADREWIRERFEDGTTLEAYIIWIL